MRRRGYLTGLCAGLAAVAGCVGSDGAGGGTRSTEADGAQRTASEPSTTVSGLDGGRDSGPGGTGASVPHLDGVDLPLDVSAFTYATGKDTIPAITDPVFRADWSGVTVPGYAGEARTPRLAPSDEVVGVVRDGEARAYPLLVLDRHEVVNDSFGGPLLVTYCPLCGSAVTAVRQVGGEPTIFGVSGKLWQSDLVLYDRRTESYWSQILATAVRGPATGERLDLVPSTLTTLGAWRAEHPETLVLRPPPESTTVTGRGGGSYVGEPGEAYEDSRLIGVTGEAETDTRIHPKTRVVGVAHDGVATAYPGPAVREAGVVNDTVGSLPVVVAAGPAETLVAYDRRVGGSARVFDRRDERHLAAAGSRWRVVSGTAIDGPHEGRQLRPATDRPPMFWFAWRNFHPGTALFGEAPEHSPLGPRDPG